MLVRGINGDFYTVMGLPIALVKRAIDAFKQGNEEAAAAPLQP